MARAPATMPRRRADEPAPAVELILLSRVAYRGQEITGPRLRGLLALLAGDLRTGCSTARLVDGLWPDEQPEHPTKALQVLVSRARAQLGADVIASTPTGYRLALADDRSTPPPCCSRRRGRRLARAGDHAAALAARRGGARAVGRGPGRATPGWTTRCRRCAPSGRRRTGRCARARALALSRLGRHAEAVGPLAELVRRAAAGRGGPAGAAALRGGDGGPGGGAGPVRGLPPLAARRARHRPRPRAAGRAPGAAAGRGARGPARGAARAEPAARPRRRHRRGGRACCARPGSPRSSAPAGSARPGSRTR